MSENKTPPAQVEMNGWLLKWTNYLRGYQRRWFVLSNGLLSYYRADKKRSKGFRLSFRRRRHRNQAEMAHTCRGTVSLHGAIIHTEDSCTFVISNGATQTFHVKAANEVERQKWVTALELAKARAIRSMESAEEEEEEYEKSATNHKAELAEMIKKLSVTLKNLQMWNDLIEKHWSALQRSLTELESLNSTQDVSAKIKAVNERATLFRITSNATINACSEYLVSAQTQGRKWQKMLQHERDQRQRLEQMVEQLARQHSNLEQAAKDHHLPRQSKEVASPSDEDDENEFYDANCDGDEDGDKSDFILKIPLGHRRTSSEVSQGSQDVSGSSSEPEADNEAKGKSKSKTMTVIGTAQSDQKVPLAAEMYQSGKGKQRRTRVPDKPHFPLSLWSIMKNCIGKELSKIPMPVNFSEPLSMLQRLTEDYEYAHVLDKAANCTDNYEQLAYIAAFTVSSYANTANRTGKPFNPLLGETFECDRMDDLGWRAISEQVSHHPPMLAQYCEGRNWRCWQEFTMASKFRGKYLQVIPLGTAHLVFNNSKNHYTWRKVTTTVHNFIVGKLWVDQHGDAEIINHATGDKCLLKYIPYSYFSKDTQRRVKGCVMNSNGEMKWVVNGEWDNKIEIAPVISATGSPDNPIVKTGPYVVAWQRRLQNPEAEKYYWFTELACQLNEPEDGVAPTDSRLRPDQRLMERGDWEAANREKVRLEEKQRAARRKREEEAEAAARHGKPYPPYEPIWFKKEEDPITGALAHVYTGKYWESKAKKDWSMCPNIF